jgi:hypothetical protein
MRRALEIPVKDALKGFQQAPDVMLPLVAPSDLIAPRDEKCPQVPADLGRHRFSPVEIDKHTLTYQDQLERKMAVDEIDALLEEYDAPQEESEKTDPALIQKVRDELQASAQASIPQDAALEQEDDLVASVRRELDALTVNASARASGDGVRASGDGSRRKHRADGSRRKHRADGTHCKSKSAHGKYQGKYPKASAREEPRDPRDPGVARMEAMYQSLLQKAPRKEKVAKASAGLRRQRGATSRQILRQASPVPVVENSPRSSAKFVDFMR